MRKRDQSATEISAEEANADLERLLEPDDDSAERPDEKADQTTE